MTAVTIPELLEAGVHFGHQTSRWNPSMKEYIFGARNGIHIIDLQQTVPLFEKAFNYVSHVVSKGGTVLFVATKKQAQDAVKAQAERCGMYHMTQRWLGGTLTNFSTIKKSIDHLQAIEKKLAETTGLTKKEQLKLTAEREKLQAVLGGIRTMSDLPKVLFVVDILKEHIAITEAKKLGIKVVAIVDTNTNPELIDYPIPGNDDAIRAIDLFASRIADAVEEGKRSALTLDKDENIKVHRAVSNANAPEASASAKA
jgi:small subunit ribosomal protein S2